jgi:ribosomal protein L12E/L44/L45/RPP1/RPP2
MSGTISRLDKTGAGTDLAAAGPAPDEKEEEDEEDEEDEQSTIGRHVGARSPQSRR